MANFTYTAKDKAGKTIRGEVEAGDKKQAMNILREKELLILKFEEAKTKASFLSFLKGSGMKKVDSDELVIFTRQMATMTDAGITIVNSLDTLADQVDNPSFKRVLQDICDSVNTGASLSEAMSKYEVIFSGYFVSMVKAGESSGMLDEVLERVARYMEKSNALQKKIKSAMIYPAVVTFMALTITLVMILKVIPVFKDMFSGFGADLPGPTQFLINLSDTMRHYFLIYVIAGVLLAIAGKWYAKTEKGKFAMDKLKLKMPVFGPLLRKVAISKFTRTLSTLVKSGVPILSALEIVADTSGNVVVERAVNQVKDSVREGESISDPMEKSGIFPPLVTRMIAVGEKSGELEKMLIKIADFYDEQVDTAVEGLTSLIEPLVIAFLGIVIGGIVICMFLPIFKMSSLIQM
ncbi:MAG: type II secretion system F family protein [Candidatus Omnitrophica bacterium]|nr:type II secretion system F family protein [Candidatus Omnitrophota bacterium]